MTAAFSSRLADRAARAGLTLSTDLSSRLVAYLELLDRWNRKINLTSLSNPDEAIDRLLLEPVVAAAHLPRSPSLADLGSGGGSPAIPLALTLGATAFLMVESKARKAAFLREASRVLGLAATVRAERFQDVAVDAHLHAGFDVVSIRALRVDQEALSASRALLRSRGTVALFRAASQELDVGVGFALTQRVRLVRPDSTLVLIEPR